MACKELHALRSGRQTEAALRCSTMEATLMNVEDGLQQLCSVSAKLREEIAALEARVRA